MRAAIIIPLAGLVCLLCSCASFHEVVSAREPPSLVIPYDSGREQAWTKDGGAVKILGVVTVLQNSVSQRLLDIQRAEAARTKYLRLCLSTGDMQSEELDMRLGEIKADMLNWDGVILLYEQVHDVLDQHLEAVQEETEGMQSRLGFINRHAPTEGEE